MAKIKMNMEVFEAKIFVSKREMENCCDYVIFGHLQEKKNLPVICIPMQNERIFTFHQDQILSVEQYRNCIGFTVVFQNSLEI